MEFLLKAIVSGRQFFPVSKLHNLKEVQLDVLKGDVNSEMEILITYGHPNPEL